MLIQWGDIIEKYNSLANVSQKILEEEIKSLCTTSECDHAFLTDLQEQWEREDKNRRTIQGIEYETREEGIVIPIILILVFITVLQVNWFQRVILKMELHGI